MEASMMDSSEESASDEFFHDSIEASRKDSRHFSDDGNEEDIENKFAQSRTNLVLDLRNVPPIGNVKSDDETSEKLSAVIEQPEEHVISENNKNEETGILIEPDLEYIPFILEILDKMEREFRVIGARLWTTEKNRSISKRGVIIDLKEEMKLALSLWRKERDEFQSLRERSDILAVEEATAAARAAAEAYAAESPLSNELGIVVNLNAVQSLSELTILEYEKKLAKYQDALALAQAEKRYNMRKRMIANTYRQRLVEVERMCNEELEKIRESANILKPLRQMAAKWSAMPQDGDTSVAIVPEWNSSACKSENQLKDVEDRYDRNSYKSRNVDEEVNMIPESVAARFSYSESCKYEKHGVARSRGRVTSQSHLLVESNSLPSTWYASTSEC